MARAVRLAWVIASAVIAPIAFMSAAKAALPIERFVEKPALAPPELSPSGRYLALAVRRGERMLVFVHDLDAPKGTQPNLIANEKLDIEWLRWVNDDRLLISVLKDQKLKAKIGDGRIKKTYDTVPVRRLVAMNRDGTNLVGLLTPDRRFRGNYDLNLIGRILPDKGEVVMAANDARGRFNLYRVNVDTGALDVIAAGERRTDSWLTDLQGVPRVRWDYNNDHDTYEMYVRRGESEAWDKIAEYGEKDLPDLKIVGFTDDWRTAIVASRQTSDRLGLYEYDIIARKLGRMLFAHPTVDVASPFGRLVYDPMSSRLLGLTYVEDLWRVHYFDNELAQLQADADAAFSDSAIVRLTSWSSDKSRVVLYTEGPKNPGSYFVFNRRKRTSELIGRVAPQLPPSELGDIEIIKYPARDGTKLTGYLTMPPGRGKKNLPMVVLPHGGPELRDSVVFDQLPQAIANQGYMVFQPNFRGSGGYGRAFAEAGHRQWGRRMQDDITDGVLALIADGSADSKRICIAGGSYGGYAALAGGAFTPELYKCVVSFSGVSDLVEMMRYERGSDPESSVYKYWLRRIGDPDRDRDELDAWSPARHAKKFVAAVLLIHGEWDGIVPLKQSLIMETALGGADKSVRLVRVKAEGHAFDDPGSPLKLLTEIQTFLARHLEP